MVLLINADTLTAIDESFNQAVKNNKKVQRLYKRIRDGTATFVDAGDFAKEIGTVLSAAFKEHISVEILPDGRLTWEIGNEIVRPEILKGYDYTAGYFSDVQSALFKEKGLNIKGVPPDVNEDRIDGILTKLYSDTYDKTGWILEDAGYLQNYFESVVDTGMKNNVGMLAQSGIRPKIVREVDAGACPWCMNLAGTYDYPTTDEVYRRHRDCHCRVTYEIPNGFRQDVWSKREWYVDEQVEARKRFQITQTKLSPERAKELEEILLNQ